MDVGGVLKKIRHVRSNVTFDVAVNFPMSTIFTAKCCPVSLCAQRLMMLCGPLINIDIALQLVRKNVK